jgi:hypothetical protein
LGDSLEWPVHWERETETVYLNDSEIPKEQLRRLPDGTWLVDLRALEERNAVVAWSAERQITEIEYEGREVWVRKGAKRVAINRAAQRMRAWQGDLLVLDTRVSTGRPSMPTPTGTFTAGPLKRRMLISRKYDNAKMPWSVQIQGDYVIHGYHSVPPRAASHGCVRVPLTGPNPAKWFYEWIKVGTPITIQDGWPEAAPTFVGRTSPYFHARRPGAASLTGPLAGRCDTSRGRNRAGRGRTPARRCYDVHRAGDNA